MASTLLSSLLGFFREVTSARFYGTQWEMDTFLAAATVPTILFGLFNGALVNAMLPTFSRYIAIGAEDEAWSLANTVLNGLLLVLTVSALVGWFLAPYYVPFIAHGFPAPQMSVAVRMTRWLMPSIVATSLAGVVAAILNAYHRFRAAALQGVAINVVTIGVVYALDEKLGIYALVLGTSLGLCAQLLVQLPAFFMLRRYRMELELSHPGLRSIGAMLVPVIVGSAAGQIALFFDRFFASTLSPGYIAGMNYATKLIGFPQQIFAAAIATVIFPLLASQFANSNKAGLRRSVTMGLRLVTFITIPATCGLIVLARPIVETLFERGSFRASATDLCVGLLPYAAFGLVAVAANIILTRVCFACHQTRWPVGISLGTVILNIVLSMVLLSPMGARGLLLANSVSQMVEAVALLALVRRFIGGLEVRVLSRSAAGAVTASVAMIMALQWIATLNVVPAHDFGPRAWYLIGQLVIGSLVFVAVCRILRLEELDMALKLIVQKFERHLPSAPESGNAPIA